MLSQVCRDNYKIMRKVSHGVEFRSRPHGQSFPHLPPRLLCRVCKMNIAGVLGFYRFVFKFNVHLWMIHQIKEQRLTVFNVSTVWHTARMESINGFFLILDQYVWSNNVATSASILFLKSDRSAGNRDIHMILYEPIEVKLTVCQIGWSWRGYAKQPVITKQILLFSRNIYF